MYFFPKKGYNVSIILWFLRGQLWFLLMVFLFLQPRVLPLVVDTGCKASTFFMSKALTPVGEVASKVLQWQDATGIKNSLAKLKESLCAEYNRIVLYDALSEDSVEPEHSQDS